MPPGWCARGTWASAMFMSAGSATCRSSPTRLCGRILNRPRRVRSTSTPGVPVTGLVALQCCRGRSCRRGCGGRSPVDRELRRIRLSRHRVDRHIVPLWDRGRRGGDAGTECVAGRCSAHRGPRARRPTRTQKVPTRDGVSQPGPRPTTRTPAGRRSHRLTGEPEARHRPPQQSSPARSLVASSTTDAHGGQQPPVGTQTPLETVSRSCGP
jgi:hypothetical protein